MQKFAQVNLSDKYVVNMGSQLGKGSTGCVYQGKDLRNNQKVAVKIIELDSINNQVTQYLLEMEKKAIMAINNPYVLKGLKIWQDKKYCFMVTEYCNGGTLKNEIQRKGKLSERKSIDLVQKILQGYQCLVDKGIVHRDLKPANIMLHEDYPKIIDFGYCEIQGNQKPSLEYNVGSPSYMAPQSFQLNIYNEKTEIWAIGVILFECVTGRTIDEGRKMTQAYKQIQQTGVPYPKYISKKIRRIVDWCLGLSPRKRPTCSQLLNQLKGLKKLQKQYQIKLCQKNDNNLIKSARITAARMLEKNSNPSNHKHDNLKYKYIPRNTAENRIRPSLSNYAKIDPTPQQPESIQQKMEIQRICAKENATMNWDYGLKKYMNSYHSKYNNYIAASKTGRQHTKGITLHQIDPPPLFQSRWSKKVQPTKYTRTYRN